MSPSATPAGAESLVTLAQAAEELGVHYMTAYRYVRTGRMVAEKRGGQWWVAPADLAAVGAQGVGIRRGAEKGSDTARALLVKPFTARLIAGDTAGCWDLISDALSAGALPVEVQTRLLQPALVAVGEQWRSGKLSVFDEHRATATASRLLGQMGPFFRHPGRRRGTIVLGAAAGDLHALPTAMMADLLSDRHFEVIDLGANTPTESFVEAAASVDDLVGIGVCIVLDECLEPGRAQVTELRAALPSAFLLVGGPAVSNAQRQGFESVVDAISTTSEEACAAFELVQ